ncbi:MAG: glutathione S-transferase [Gammaproteobacteria bacterium]|uniref:glutathione transferase n=1 Tax=OM182 bacterium MED-G24 TaxID=1986255 RepID=A0A2A5WL72_9GAMM|nr:glutathione S-transferase [Gammaproteobacteria bacterium]PDH36974.1 MAG: glutathione S-transferase [OM182 bacterium MED-G24]|tara:strand:+ start:791 stop:1492 length:702 start_codon:yes stop_codon:yes gene_type:complete
MNQVHYGASPFFLHLTLSEMPMITIHGSPVSPFVRKTLIVLAEKGIEHEVNPVSPFPAPESHLKISPLGKIPAMTDGDLAIPDSSAICGYLEKRFPENPMYPDDDGEFGRALWYEDWADNELPKATAALFFNRVAVRMMKREPDEALIQKIITKAQPPIFDYLEAEIGDKTYLAGDAFSIADIAVTCQFIQMMYSGEALPEDSHPNITRFVTTHMHRLSFKNLINNDLFMSIE